MSLYYKGDSKMKSYLDQSYDDFNKDFDIKSYPDPLMIAKRHLDNEFIFEISLICALYAYGSTKAINKKLSLMPFDIFKNIPFTTKTFLSKNKEDNLNFLKQEKNKAYFKNAIQQFDTLCLDIFPLYRFQTKEDTRSFFKILLICQIFGGIKNILLRGFDGDILNCIYFTQEVLNLISSEFGLNSKGLLFLIGNQLNKKSPLKRFNMYLRWMVRKDNIDLGLLDIPKDKLILPLDTHTFQVCTKLGLLNRKNYDIKSAILITEKLREFDRDDPVKYDFALYRIGQLKLS